MFGYFDYARAALRRAAHATFVSTVLIILIQSFNPPGFINSAKLRLLFSRALNLKTPAYFSSLMYSSLCIC